MMYVKRVYDHPEPDGSRRFLVDRVWPRGIKREALALDGSVRDVAPSDELRRWFGHDPAKWEEFRGRYFEESNQKPERWRQIQQAVEQGDVTLLYGARDTEHNSAVALREYLEARTKAGKRS